MPDAVKNTSCLDFLKITKQINRTSNESDAKPSVPPATTMRATTRRTKTSMDHQINGYCPCADACNPAILGAWANQVEHAGESNIRKGTPSQGKSNSLAPPLPTNLFTCKNLKRNVWTPQWETVFLFSLYSFFRVKARNRSWKTKRIGAGLLCVWIDPRV